MQLATLIPPLFKWTAMLVMWWARGMSISQARIETKRVVISIKNTNTKSCTKLVTL